MMLREWGIPYKKVGIKDEKFGEKLDTILSKRKERNVLKLGLLQSN